ncbi:hypothetical protein QEN19_002121 [Hanseniaspora menglaensis]
MSSSQRKLYQEIDKSLKKVREGIQDFDQIYTVFEQTDPSNQTYREKLEVDINKQIKKLQKQREQIKTWLAKEDVKDKEIMLFDARKNIEQRMETAKVVEKMVKLKKFSTQALANPDMAIHPKDLKKYKLIEFLQECIDELSKQREMLEGEIEQGNDDMHTEHLLDRHIFNVVNLENILKLVNTDGLDVETVEEFKDDIQYYVDNNMDDPDFIEYDTIYEDLGCEVYPNENGELDVTASTSVIAGSTKELTPSGGPSVEGTPKKSSRLDRSDSALLFEKQSSVGIEEESSIKLSPILNPPVSAPLPLTTKSDKLNKVISNQRSIKSENGFQAVLPAVHIKPIQSEALQLQQQLSSTPITPILGNSTNSLLTTLKKQTPTPISTPKLNNSTPLALTPQSKTSMLSSLAQSATKRTQNTTTSVLTTLWGQALKYQVETQVLSDVDTLSQLPESLQFPGLKELLQTRKDISIPKQMDTQIEEMLKYSLLNSPDSLDADFKMSKNKLSRPHPTSIFFPQQPLQFLDNINTIANQTPALQLIFSEEDKLKGFLKLKPLDTDEGFTNWCNNIVENDSYSSLAACKIATKFELETLFFTFYHYQDSFEQFVSARELNLRGWLFEKNESKWYKQVDDNVWQLFDYEDEWKVLTVGNYQYNPDNFENLDFTTAL